MKKSNIIAILLTVLFILLTVLVKLDLVSSFDSTIYNLVTSNINETNTKIFKCLTFLGSTAFIVSLSAFFVILFFILKKKNWALFVLILIVLSTIINNVVKIIIVRERPEVLAMVIETSYSYPSGHTMASVTLYGSLLYLVLKLDLKKYLKVSICTILGLLPILIGISRIYLGVHFATDVIGAFLASTILLLFAVYFVEKKELL